jgi:hypothetical protein
MERDTVNVPESDSAQVPEDTSETSLNTNDTSINIADTSSAQIAVAVDTAITEVDSATTADTASPEAVVADTAAAGYTKMARDTSTTADQIDTSAAAVEADGAIQVSVDTAHADAEVTADTDVSVDTDLAVADTASVAIADTVEAERLRPPEDSTELLGYVGDETADEQEVTSEQQLNANEEAISADDRETVAAAEVPADEVGAAAIGGTVTGEDAVALMTRQGARCEVVDPETDEELRWDMSSTPVTLNPCGMGTMNLSKVWTSGGGGQD